MARHYLPITGTARISLAAISQLEARINVPEATMNASYQTWGTFVSHGWDINASIDSNTPKPWRKSGPPRDSVFC
jgi:hypothetical protein